jgi:hypothetical protein
MGAPHPPTRDSRRDADPGEKFFAAPSAQKQRRLLGYFDKG